MILASVGLVIVDDEETGGHLGAERWREAARTLTPSDILVRTVAAVAGTSPAANPAPTCCPGVLETRIYCDI